MASRRDLFLYIKIQCCTITPKRAENRKSSTAGRMISAPTFVNASCVGAANSRPARDRTILQR